MARLKRQAEEFLERANECGSYEDIVRLAGEYVALADVPPVEQAPNRRIKLDDDGHSSLFLLDPLGWQILEANETAARRLGYRIEELTQRTIGDLACPPMVPSGPCSPAGYPRNRAIRGELAYKGSVTFESAHRRRDGTAIPVMVTLSLTEHEGGRAVLATARDISEHKRIFSDLARLQEYLSTVTDKASVAIGMQDRAGVFRYVNTALATMLDYQENDLVGQPVASVLDAASRQTLRRQLTKRRHGISDSYGLTYVRRDGTKVPALLSPTPLFDANGHFHGSLGTLIPIDGDSYGEQPPPPHSAE